MIRELCGNTNAIAFWFYIFKIIIFERYFEKMRKKKCSKWISAVMGGLVVLGSLSGCGLGILVRHQIIAIRMLLQQGIQ